MSRTGIKIELPVFEPILFPDFIEWDNCIIFKQSEPDLPHFEPNNFCNDRTGYEANTNHIHLSDYVDDFDSFKWEYLRLGINIINLWRDILKSNYPNYKFHLILSYDEEDCILRCHRIREGETPWLDTDSIENFSEGVLVLQIL